MNVKLKTLQGKEVLVNWDSVCYVKGTVNHFDENYTEVHFGKTVLDVRQTVGEVENLTNIQS